MDAAGLTILSQELQADCEVATDAAQNARRFLEQRAGGYLEASAYELGRMYNVLERMLERICAEFENHFEKRGDYHERLLQRLTLDLPELRPAFLPKEHVSALRELKGFRHVMRHAYDLTLRADRLAELSHVAQQVSELLPTWCLEFVNRVRQQQGWD